MKAWQRALCTVVLGGAVTLTSTWTGAPVQAQASQRTAVQIVRIAPEESILFTIQFIDGFRAKVVDNKTRATTYIDIKENKDEYLRRGIYNKQGKVTQPTNGFSDKLAELVPYVTENGSIQYVGRQRMWGLHGNDQIAHATSIWKLENQKPKLVGLTVSPGESDNFPSPDVFLNTGISLDKDITFVLDTKYADVNGDGIKDHVMLVGHKEGAAFGLPVDDLRIVVREGRRGQHFFASVGKLDAGYLPKLNIGYINSDKVKDILVTIPTKNGRVYSALTWKYTKFVPLIDQAALNNPKQYKVTLDGQGVGTSVQSVRSAKK
ncbi:hypothetical protein I532_17788 [Brevibacillus borstelensis AK1]|uniref:Uncharacterized protein n=1 Tax=Brevibacillus borstelensis AK1 TaxID=1300222 RepID=M8D568_9BACL|nr:hypothetical protein [Brevibacillus borstelensis]EMT51429.1 hypothetical protein I532_17788 [Brevibacillus borstelensis AK1]